MKNYLIHYWHVAAGLVVILSVVAWYYLGAPDAPKPAPTLPTATYRVADSIARDSKTQADSLYEKLKTPVRRAPGTVRLPE